MNENVMNGSIDRELGWEDVIQNDSTGGVLLPEGEYSFVVTAVERARHGGSAKLPPCNKSILTLSLADDAGRTGQLRHNLFLHTKCEGLLCAFFLAIGLRQHGEPLRMRWDIVGRRGRCQVSQRSYTGNDGKEHKTNDIERFLEPVPTTSALPQYQPFAQTAQSMPQLGYPPVAPAQQPAEQTVLPLPRQNPWQSQA